MKLSTSFNWGAEIKNVNPTLYNQLNDSRFETVNVVNSKPSSFIFNVDPIANSNNNKLFDVGDFYINSTTNNAWIMTSRTTSTVVTWKIIT